MQKSASRHLLPKLFRQEADLGLEGPLSSIESASSWAECTLQARDSIEDKIGGGVVGEDVRTIEKECPSVVTIVTTLEIAFNLDPSKICLCQSPVERVC